MNDVNTPAHVNGSAGRDEPATVTPGEPVSDRERVVAREKEQFGGMKFGSAFFGWLTAVGLTVILTAILTAIGVGVGLGSNPDANAATEEAAANASTIGIVGSIALAVILFVSYYCGGYVAGRMARFSGAKQGIAVWLWALVIAIVLAIVGLIAGSQAGFSNMTSGVQLPADAGELTAGSIISALVALVVTLGGAVLGGIAGMRFHRRVDEVGLGR